MSETQGKSLSREQASWRRIGRRAPVAWCENVTGGRELRAPPDFLIKHSRDEDTMSEKFAPSANYVAGHPVTFLMVFVIQNSQNRDSSPLQAKVDELIRASAARNSFVGSISSALKKSMRSAVKS